MDIELENKSGWIVLNVKGRLDAFNYELLANRLRTLLKAGKKQIAIDLTAVHVNMFSAKLLGTLASQFHNFGGCIRVITQLERTRELLIAFSKPGVIQFYTDFESAQNA